jgi:arylsulfatase A-like enzyme
MVDWYPTLLKLAGASLEQDLPLDGKDLWPVLTEGKPSPHEEILLNAAPSGGAIRAGDWKLVVRGDRSATDETTVPHPKPKKKRPRAKAQAASAAVELFHLTDDPYEQSNLAQDHPEKVQELRSRLDAYARQAAPPKNAPKAPDFQTPAVWGEVE